MGLINLDAIKLKSGLSLKDCYLSFNAGPTVMPSPITMSWNVSWTGEKQYYANATLYIYANQENKASGCEPLETKQLMIPIDSSGVFAILFASLKKEFPNNIDISEDVTEALPSSDNAEDSAPPQSDSDPPQSTS